MALTDLSVVDMVEDLPDIVEKRTNNCFSIGAIPILDYGCKPSDNVILIILIIRILDYKPSVNIILILIISIMVVNSSRTVDLNALVAL